MRPSGPWWTAGRTVLLPDPIYDAYDAPIALWGGEPTPVPATLRDGRFIVGSRDFEDSLGDRRRRDPAQHALEPGRHGPDPRGARRTSWTSPRNTTYLVISDEIYESLVYDGRRHVSPASVSADARERTIVINSLSKTYAMTGWRVGYCAGPEAIIRAMLLVLQQSSRGPATFVQDAAACALTSDQECVRRMAAEYQGRRDRVVDRLRGIPGVEPLVPEGGLFVMVDVRGLGRPSDEVRRFLLHEAGVVVHPRRGLRAGRARDSSRLVRGGRRDPRARPGPAPRGAAATRGRSTDRRTRSAERPALR